MRCARHPNVETELTCTRCSTPICPDCLVPGAVGMLCKSCAGSNVLFQIPLWRLALAAAAGIAFGLVGTYLMRSIGFFILFAGSILGGLIGQAILWITKRRRSQVLELLTGVSIVIGGALSLLIDNYWMILLRAPQVALWPALGLGFMTAAAVSRVRW